MNTHLLDPVRRFSSKADQYARYRWDFSNQAIDAIIGITHLSEESLVADIGSGTGKLSQHFVDRVKRVYAIEPNGEMRMIAENSLRQYASFVSIEAFSDATSLPDHSIDLIVVGRALHWFPPDSSRSEFIRILKPDGWLAVLQVPCPDDDLVEAIRSIRTEQNGWNIEADKARLEQTSPSFFFGSEEFIRGQFPETKLETWPEFFGRISSVSAAPDKNHPGFPYYEIAARKIFDQFSRNGRLTVHASTEIHLGKIMHHRVDPN